MKRQKYIPVEDWENLAKDGFTEDDLDEIIIIPAKEFEDDNSQDED